MYSIRVVSLLSLLFVSAVATVGTAAPIPAGVHTVPLATVTNDRDGNVSRLDLMVGDNVVRGVYLYSNSGGQNAATPAIARVYPLPEIESKDGVVLGQGQGEKAIFLQGTIASQAGSGSLVIRYLNNGIFHWYSECRVDLRRVSPGHWQLVNAYDGQPIEHIEVQTWALGISTIANVCPGSTLG